MIKTENFKQVEISSADALRSCQAPKTLLI